MIFLKKKVTVKFSTQLTIEQILIFSASQIKTKYDDNYMFSFSSIFLLWYTNQIKHIPGTPHMYINKKDDAAKIAQDVVSCHS